MSTVIETVFSTTTVHRALTHLLDSYLVEKEAGNRDNDTPYMQYWESACQTIYEVAEELSIPLEKQPSRRPPVIPDSRTPLAHADVQQTEGVGYG
jgi:hypothetical protein